MSIYEIMHFANTTLQGQFRKYSSIIDEVVVRCVQSSNSLEDAKEMFNSINLAVSRILSTGIDRPNVKNISEDTPEILAYAQKLNEFMDVEKAWMQLKVLEEGKVVKAINNKTGNEKTGKIAKIDYAIKVNFGDEIMIFSKSSWDEWNIDKTKTNDFFSIKEVF